MIENNELLIHLYQISDMGVKSTAKLIKMLKNKDNKIKKILDDQLKNYKIYLSKINNILKNKNINSKSFGIIPELMANMEMKWEVIKDNSDAKMADLLIRGFTMGSIETEKKINNYKRETDKKIIELAKEILKFQQKEIENLKPFL